MQVEWEKTAGAAHELRERTLSGMFAKYPELSELFAAKPTCVCCMDERVVGQVAGLAVAGSGLLLDDAGRAELIEHLQLEGITEVSRHEGCGAEALYGQMHKLSSKELEAHAKAWIEELNEAVGGGEIRRFGVEPKFHTARALFIDATGKLTLNHEAAKRLPSAFVVSEPYIPLDHVIEQTSVGLDIAFGDHGFGERFTKEEPFVIGIIAPDEQELLIIRSQGEFKKLLQAHGDRVRVDTHVIG